MRLTLGDDAALTEEAVIETLQRVSSEIKKEESQKFSAEREAHQRTHDELVSERAEKAKLQERLYWRCRRQARLISWIASAFVLTLLVAGLLAGLGLRSSNQTIGLLLALGSGVLFVLSLSNFIFGTTLKRVRERVQNRCLGWLIRRELAATGLELTNVERGTTSAR